MAEEAKNKVILLVEDERPLIEIIQKQLRLHDLDTVTARSVDQAEDYLQELGTVDAVWLDHYLLGSKSGLDMVARLKSDAKYRDIPIFLVSNTASDEKINSYIELGVEKYYAKINHRLADIVSAVAGKVLGQK